MTQLNCVRNFHTHILRLARVVPNNLKGRSKSSQEWLQRQLTDPFVEKAKMQNYRWSPYTPLNRCISDTVFHPRRCRSAFKLLEIDQKTNLLQPGQVILDAGAAPGSWTQIAVSKTNANGAQPNLPIGFVVSIDLLQIYPIKVRKSLNAFLTKSPIKPNIGRYYSR